MGPRPRRARTSSAAGVGWSSRAAGGGGALGGAGIVWQRPRGFRGQTPGLPRGAVRGRTARRSRATGGGLGVHQHQVRPQKGRPPPWRRTGGVGTPPRGRFHQRECGPGDALDAGSPGEPIPDGEHLPLPPRRARPVGRTAGQRGGYRWSRDTLTTTIRGSSRCSVRRLLAAPPPGWTPAVPRAPGASPCGGPPPRRPGRTSAGTAGTVGAMGGGPARRPWKRPCRSTLAASPTTNNGKRRARNPLLASAVRGPRRGLRPARRGPLARASADSPVGPRHAGAGIRAPACSGGSGTNAQ